jgi:hypothetical protein
MSRYDTDVESLPSDGSERVPEREKTEVKGEGQQDSNIVDFDGPTDPENPLNWSTSRKTTSIVIVSLTALLS